MNEAALRQIDVLIRHGAKLPLSTYIMLREAEKYGFRVYVRKFLYTRYIINVTLSTNRPDSNRRVTRKLKVDEAKFANGLHFDSHAYRPHWKKAPKNSTNTLWWHRVEASDIPEHDWVATKKLDAEIDAIERERRKSLSDEDDVDQ